MCVCVCVCHKNRGHERENVPDTKSREKENGGKSERVWRGKGYLKEK